MRSPRGRSRRRIGRDGAQWLSFSDLMSSLLLIFILIMFYIMYQYFDMYEINMAEIARQQYDLDQANADLAAERTKLSDAESQMLAQQIKLNAAQKDLTDAEAILASQQADLAAAKTLLDDKETQINEQQAALDALSLQLNDQQTQINEQQATLNAQAATLATQEQTLNAQAATLASQKETLTAQEETLIAQQATLEDQQRQLEQLVGMRPRIISSVSAALRAANISAQVDPTNGAIALESDVLFSTGQYELSPQGRAFIDRFLPVYLSALFTEEYQPYVAEILIEGHTDSRGDYISNLELSQRRALAVASYVLSDSCTTVTPAQKARLRQMATANGRSSSDPVLYPDGTENMDASRRVVFKFRLTDEQMIRQLKDILESEDLGAAGANE